MITGTEKSDLPNRMNIWTTVGGYGGALLIMTLMFALAESVGG